MADDKSHQKWAERTEQALRDARDRETKGPKRGAGEPRYRNGADTHDLDEEGWAEAPEQEPK